MSFIHENIILPLGDLVRGEHTAKYLRLLEGAEDWSSEQMADFQNARLQQLVQYVAARVPFYRNWFLQSGINPMEIKTVADLKSLPIVDKSLMRREGISRFAAEGFSERQRLNSRSSGSTGEPFSFYISKLSNSVNTAAKLRTWYQAGYRLGDKYMKIANGERHGKLKKLQDKVNNCLYVPFFSMSNNRLDEILHLIEVEKPTIIRSYPVPLYLLAQRRSQYLNQYQFHPHHIMTTGSTLPQLYREEIERAFGCDIIDSYSCEGTSNTYETPAHDGYNQTSYYGIIEVLDDHNQSVSNGVGRVISTDFWNFAHPFIRYNTQDLVEVKNGRIIRIMGRECESLVVTGNTRFTVHNFVGFFQENNRPIKETVTAYQLVKKHDGSFLFRLVVTPQYSEAIQQYIIDFWTKQFNRPVTIEIVPEIPLMHNNKRLTIVEEQ